MGKLRVGEPETTPDAPAHTSRVKEGNAKGNYDKQKGHLEDGRVTAERSTGINPEQHDPILPTMPNLPPP